MDKLLVADLQPRLEPQERFSALELLFLNRDQHGHHVLLKIWQLVAWQMQLVVTTLELSCGKLARFGF